MRRDASDHVLVSSRAGSSLNNAKIAKTGSPAYFHASTRRPPVNNLPQTLMARHMTLHTLDADISGTFKTSPGFLNTGFKLNIHTERAGSIDAKIALAGGRWLDSSVDLATQHGAINATLDLSCPISTFIQKDLDCARFSVEARSNDAPITVDVASASEGQPLHLTAKTTNAPVLVSLPQEFEGRMTVTSDVRHGGGASIERLARRRRDDRVLRLHDTEVGVKGTIFLPGNETPAGLVLVRTTGSGIARLVV